MTTEQKARAYDEALERARAINNGKDVDIEAGTTTCEYIFPELKVSEDERLRKDCIKYLDWEYQHCSFNEDKMKIEKCIAWLEKQDEQKPDWSEEDEKMVNDIIAAIDTLYYHGMVNWLKSLKQRIGQRLNPDKVIE